MSRLPTSRSDDQRPFVVAMTGGSGAVYTVRLVQQLLLAGHRVHWVMSSSAKVVLKQELGISSVPTVSMLEYRWPNLEERWGEVPSSEEVIRQKQWMEHEIQDYMVPIASGSYLTGGMVVCPCSGSTLSGIAHATGSNLIHRAAEVHLKEKRKLILVPRETPMSVFQLENMHRLAQAGAVVLPAMPGWYHGVSSLLDLVDFIVARILDQLEVPHRLIKRWGVEG